MIRWFHTRKLRTKILMWYTAFALLPMILITIYFHFYTRQLLVENLTRNLDGQISKIERELNDKIGNYYTISNLLYMDESLWSYMTADYSRRGYEDLYLYVDTLFSNIRMLYPEIDSLCVYSSNPTLPRDDYYFHVLEEDELALRYREPALAGNVMQLCPRSDADLCFVRRMNRYGGEKYLHFLEIHVHPSVLQPILESVDERLSAVLTDPEGVILLSGRGELATMSCRDLDLSRQVVRRRNIDHCGELLVYMDLKTFDRPVFWATLRIFFIFALSSGLAFAAISRYSSYFQKNVEFLMNGASEISFGNFTRKIPVTGTDEISMIAQSINMLGEQVQKTIEESWKKELDQRISELNQLQEQINPHFLYNALSSISSMALNHQDPETSQAIIYLADFYRLSLNKGNQELTIRDELHLLESYMRIQHLRFGDGIVLEYCLDDTLLDHRVMKLTLQPLVENAIHHGRMDDSESFHILIRLYRQAERTILEVIDDGRGIPPEKMLELQDSLDQSDAGHGLRNVNVRIRLQYGDEYGISLESEEGFGTKVRIELP